MAATFEPPVPRQPACRYCGHDDHVFTRCGSEFGESGVLCPCPPHRPNGIYDDTPPEEHHHGLSR